MDQSASGATRRNHERLLQALQHLLSLKVSDLEAALDAAAQQIADVMRADKVDVFLHEAATATLLAVGTNDSPMARHRRRWAWIGWPLPMAAPARSSFGPDGVG